MRPLLRLALALLVSLCVASLSPAHASPTTADAPVDPVEERRANLDLALRELNSIAASGPADADAAAAAPPPRWALHDVFTETPVHESRGNLVRRVPVYRTVQGYDEVRRRVVRYKTLVHEEQVYSAVVDRSITYHLVLRPAAAGEDSVTDAVEQAQGECAAATTAADAATPSCSQPLPPSPESHVHAVLTVSTDRQGHRAVVSLRSASADEIGSWFDARAPTTTPTTTTDPFPDTWSLASERARQAQEFYYRTIHARLQGLPPLKVLSSNLVDRSDLLSGRLRVMSANIFNTNYWERRKPLIKQALYSEQEGGTTAAPDVIAFQEVRALRYSSPSSSAPKGVERTQVRDLVAMLPDYEYTWVPAMGFRESDGQWFVQEGLAVFSRWPLTGSRCTPLPRDAQDGDDFHQRVVLQARVQTPWGGVHVLNTHLSLSGRARARSVEVIGSLGQAALPEPSIVLGDFNAPAGAEPAALAEGPFKFRDAWMQVQEEAHRQQQQQQQQQQGLDNDLNILAPSSELRDEWDRQGHTFHSWDRRSRIDLILSNSRGEAPKQQQRATQAETADSDEVEVEVEAEGTCCSASPTTDGAADAAFAAPADSSSLPGHVTDPLLHPVSMSVVGSTGVPLHGETLELLGGVADLRGTMYPSDHMFPLTTFRVRRLTDREREGEEARVEAERRREAERALASIAAIFGNNIAAAAQEQAAPLAAAEFTPLDLDSDEPVPLVAGIGFKDEL